ncbi:hypothetical protein MtrunA17_Chr2g0318691 [Medicago truncatula]|nr:hypothetical protein MtrunA17_Chr2g0318691 [Medicago truncatula]
MKKILSRRKRKKDSMFKSNNDTKLEIINKHKTTTHETTSNTSSINFGSAKMFSSSSSLNSSTSSHSDRMSNSSTFEINNTPKPPSLTGTNGISKKINSVVDDKRKRNIILCILWIINLLVLILWGKFFAILCTSIWFYLLPFRHRKEMSREDFFI